MVSYGCGNRCIVYIEYLGDDDEEESLRQGSGDIYFSNVCDEDYQFGNTHEELVKARGEQY